MDNFMMINNKNVDIGLIELDEDELFISDKSSNYCFKVYIPPQWDSIRKLKIGENKEIRFGEYVFSENNMPALLNPAISSVKKLNDE